MRADEPGCPSYYDAQNTSPSRSKDLDELTSLLAHETPVTQRMVEHVNADTVGLRKLHDLNCNAMLGGGRGILLNRMALIGPTRVDC